MRKILSMILAIVMIISVLPMSAFATEEVVAPTEVSKEGNKIPENYGIEVTVGSNIYYIEDGDLLYSSNNGRPKTINNDVTWIIEEAGEIFYSKLEGYNTYIYKDGEDAEVAKLYCPIECFDVEGENVYYSYNGEITMLHTTDGCETYIGAYGEDASAFYVNNGGIEFICDENNTNEDETIELYAYDANPAYTGGGIEYVKKGLFGAKTKVVVGTKDDKEHTIIGYKRSGNFLKPDIKLTFKGNIKMSFIKYKAENNSNVIWYEPNVDANDPYRTADFEKNLFKESDIKKYFSDTIRDGAISKGEALVYSQMRSSHYSESNTTVYLKSSCSGQKVFLRSAPTEDTNDKSAVVPSITLTGHVYNSYGHMWYTTSTGKYIYSKRIDDYYCEVYESEAKQYNSGNVISNGDAVKNSTPNTNKQQSLVQENVEVNWTSFPSAIYAGQSFPLRGKITSTYPIYYTSGNILDSSGNGILSWIDNSYRGAKQITIDANHPLDARMTFGSIKTPGNYKVRIIVNCNANGSQDNIKIFDFPFTVITDQQCDAPSVQITGVGGGQKATFTCAANETIRYSINGGSEQVCNNGFSKTFDSPGTYSIRAYTTASGYNQSAEVFRTFTVSKVETPIISRVHYSDDKAWVTISGNGNIYYTKNGTYPNKNSTTYDGIIYLEKGKTTIKAFASQYGKANSDIVSGEATVSAPMIPVGLELYNTKEKIAQGKTATFTWKPTIRATGYIAKLYYNGKQVGEPYVTKGTTASFKLDEVGIYTVKVTATNCVGEGGESAGVSVESMAPVKVTFVDRILREGIVTDEVVEQIQQNLNEHYGNDDNPDEIVKPIEGNVISVQEIDYDSKPSIPTWEDKDGLSRQYFDEEAYVPATEDKTVYAYYSVKSYNVSFWNFFAVNSPKNGQIGIPQSVLYTFSAEPPTGFEIPEGCVLAGWNVDAKESQCFDFTFVEGDMKLDTVYTWENEDLPVVLEIISAKRGNTCEGYDVELKYTNYNLSDTQARIIVALYTSDGRVVDTAIEDVDLSKGIFGESVIETVQSNYEGKISRISAVMVRDKDDLTGGAVSEMVSTTEIEFPNADTYWTEWSEWSVEVPDENPAHNGYQPGNERDIQEKIQYRYRNKDYISSASSNLAGWEKYNTRRTGWSGTYGPVYSNPSNGVRNVWSESYVASSNYKTVYRYYRYSNSICATWGSSYPDYANYYEWEFDYPLELKAGQTYSYKLWCGCGVSGGYHTVYSVNWQGHGAYPASKWVSDNWATRWYYQEPIYTYDYWKWGNWSSWSDIRVGGDEVQTRSVYRYRDNYSVYEGYDPSKEGTEAETFETYEISGNIPGLEKDYNGKLATVLVYKKTNTDPTQEQLEYVDQITLGENNSYSFVVNPKERIDYAQTGDYVVTLSIEGCERLVNIDIIKAPRPQCHILFQDAVGNVLMDANGNPMEFNVEKGTGFDVSRVPIPEKEGYEFVKWDASLINIQSDVTVAPVYRRNSYSVVFVDHENESATMVEVQYGSPVDIPVVQEIEGKVFDGWNIENHKFAADGKIDTDVFTSREETPYYRLTNDTYILTTEYNPEIDEIIDETLYYKYSPESDAIITESKVVTARWNTLNYTVKFCDFEGNIVSEQQVEYGYAAKLPDMVEKGGVKYQWDINGDEWWNVTCDMTISPVVPQTVFIDAPVITSEISNTVGDIIATLETVTQNTKIFYAYDHYITEKEVQKFALDLFENNEPEEESISLMSETVSEEGDAIIETEEVIDTVAPIIQEYTDPISIKEGSILYAFTVDENGNISTISVFSNEGESPEDYLGDTSNEYIPEDNLPQIVMDTMIAEPGEVVKVPVTIKNNMGINNLSLLLGFNDSDLVLDEIENGNVFDDNQFSYEMKDDGCCKFIWESNDDNTKDGVLMYLTFAVKEEAEKSKYMLDLYVDNSSDENDEEWYFVTVPGAITEDTRIMGDVNGDGEVDFADGIRILKHDVGLIDLAGDALVTGDVNGDGEVDFADAILVLKFDVGLISSFKK